VTTRLSSYFEFASLWALSVVIAWHTLVATFAIAWNNDEYTHILLILPTSAALVWIDWHTSRRVSAQGRIAGATMLGMACLAAAYVRWSGPVAPDARLFLAMLALVIWWIGSFVLCFGIAASRDLAFPLCFLLWLAPFPAALLESIIDLLQRGSAFAAHLLFAIAGVPVAQDGLMLSLPGLTVEVAKECSSIRSSLMLLVTTMVLSQVLLRSPLRRGIVIALALPLSVAKNGLRIFTIAMLGTQIDRGFLTGRLHHDGGIIFFAIALILIFLLLWIMRRMENGGTNAAVHSSSVTQGLPLHNHS
jgi:exosortase